MKSQEKEIYDLSIIIPIYNEERVLKKNINKICEELEKRSVNYELILSENGSTDNTVELITNLYNSSKKIRYIHLNYCDYGKALKEGMLICQGKIIVNFDIDFYDIEFCMKASALEPFGYDVIVASKNSRLSKDNRKLSRKLISGIYKYILYYGFGLNVSDTHGIKAWRNDDILRKLITETKHTREIFDTELIIRSQYKGRNLLELPISIIETRKSVSPIYKRAFRGFLQIMKLWYELKILKKI